MVRPSLFESLSDVLSTTGSSVMRNIHNYTSGGPLVGYVGVLIITQTIHDYFNVAYIYKWANITLRWSTNAWTYLLDPPRTADIWWQASLQIHDQMRLFGSRPRSRREDKRTRKIRRRPWGLSLPSSSLSRKRRIPIPILL